MEKLLLASSRILLYDSPTKINQNQLYNSMHLARVCELPKANPLPKGRSLEVKRHTSDAQCPVRTWKRHAEL